MTGKPLTTKSFRSIDDVLAWCDQLFEDKRREYETRIHELETNGGELEWDAIDESIADARRDFAVQREQFADSIRRTFNKANRE